MRTVKKAAMFGGTVNSWAVVDVYPMPEIMDGRNKVKLCWGLTMLAMLGEPHSAQ
jgi:hypothetical protein